MDYDLSHLRALPHEQFEALCTKCGKCCLEKVEIDGVAYASRKPCRFLDKGTKLCTVYEKRFEAEPGCNDILNGIPLGLFPADCPYVAQIPGYVAPLETWDDPDIDATIRDVLGDDALDGPLWPGPLEV